MKLSNIAYIAAAGLLCAPAAMAQDITTEITVERTIVPEQRSAERPSGFMPVVQLPGVELKPLALHEYLKASQLTTIVPVLEPASYADTIAVSPYNGYGVLGYFPVYNLDISAGYRFINTHNTRLGAWGQFGGMSYSGDGELDGVTFSDNNLDLGVDFNRLFGPGHLGAGIRYTFGRNGFSYDGQSYHRTVNALQANAGWWGRSGKIRYRAAVDFEYFRMGNFDAQVRFKPVAGVMLGGEPCMPSGGIDLRADLLTGDNPGIVGLTPYYNYNSAALHAHLGLKVEVDTRHQLRTDGSGNRSVFHVAPDVILGWTPSAMFGIEAHVSGGERLNTISDFYARNHFISPYGIEGYSNVPVDSRLRFTVGPVAGVSFELFGGYSMASDWLMPSFVANPNPIIGTPVELKSFMRRADIKGWLLGVGVGYRWRELVDFKATAQMAPQQADRGYYGWMDHARYVVEGSVKVHPVAKLDIDINYSFRGSRALYGYAFNDILYTGAVSTQAATERWDMGNVSDLGLGAAYRITDALSVWGRCDNLLGRRYFTLPGVQAPGIKGLLGVAYKF